MKLLKNGGRSVSRQCLMVASEHFSEHELKCSCGCNRSDMDEEFLELLEDLRVWYGKPMILSSGFRCPAYNNHVSGTGYSGPHTTGQAVDVLIHGVDVLCFLKGALKLGFSGIGVNQKGRLGGRFIHLDNLSEPDFPRPRLWTY